MNNEVNSKPKFFSKENFKRIFNTNGTRSLIASLICIVAALLLGLIILIFINPSLAFSDFGVMISGNVFGSTTALGNVKTIFTILAKSAPLMCCGLAIIFSQKSGMFNIGAAGQYVMGMFGALIFALQIKAPWYICLLMAGVFGAFWGALPGIFKAFFNVNEVISGIMLNWIALFFVNYSFQTYLSSCTNVQQGAKTFTVSALNPNGRIPNFGLGEVLGNSFSIAILFAVFLVISCWFYLNKTTIGYQLRASGFNKDAARYAGMNEKKNIILSLAVSGALAGFGAAMYYLVDLEQWQAGMSQSLPSMPWNGITVAFIAQGNPIACLFSSLFVTILTHGSRFMTQTSFPFEIADMITGIIVYLSGFSSFIVGILIKYKGHYKDLFSTIGHNFINGCKTIYKKVSGFFIKLWHKICSLFKKKDNVESKEDVVDSSIVNSNDASNSTLENSEHNDNSSEQNFDNNTSVSQSNSKDETDDKNEELGGK